MGNSSKTKDAIDELESGGGESAGSVGEMMDKLGESAGGCLTCRRYLEQYYFDNHIYILCAEQGNIPMGQAATCKTWEGYPDWKGLPC